MNIYRITCTLYDKDYKFLTEKFEGKETDKNLLVDGRRIDKRNVNKILDDVIKNGIDIIKYVYWTLDYSKIDNIKEQLKQRLHDNLNSYSEQINIMRNKLNTEPTDKFRDNTI